MQRQMQSIAAMKTKIASRTQTVTKTIADSRNGFFLLPPPPGGRTGAVMPQCPALPATEVDDLVTQAGEASSVSPDLLRAVIKQESGFRPCAVSEKGAMGLMQLMPSTASGLGVHDPLDPQENVMAGAKFLKQLINLNNGDLSLALSAYNAGPGRVDLSTGIPKIPETINYVNKVLSFLPVSELTGLSRLE